VARDSHGSQAAVALALAAAATLGFALLALSEAAPAVRWSFAVPVIPTLLVIGAIVRGAEKSWAGEMAVAVTFSLTALPVALSAGAAPRTGWAIAIAFGVVFCAATLAVRTVVLGVRGGGNPRAVRVSRAAVLLVSSTAVLGLAMAVQGQLIPLPRWPRSSHRWCLPWRLRCGHRGRHVCAPSAGRSWV
jgi:hypothetical protein